MSKSQDNNMIENESGTKFINTHNLSDFSTTEALHTPLLSTSQGGMVLADVSDPTAPRVVGSNEFHFRGEPTDIALSGWFAYVTTRGNGGIWSGGDWDPS